MSTAYFPVPGKNWLLRGGRTAATTRQPGLLARAGGAIRRGIARVGGLFRRNR